MYVTSSRVLGSPYGQWFDQGHAGILSHSQTKSRREGKESDAKIAPM